MANKKISQLNAVDSSVGIGTESVFPMVSGTNSSNYQTTKVTSLDIAKFVLNPMPVGGSADLSSIGFTGAANVYFDKSNWIDTSNAGTHAFVMVNKDDGQLTTGSGIGVVAGGDNMGDCKATQAINMQGNDINNLDQVRFQGAAHSIFHRSNTTDIILQAQNDLILSGKRHVSISGQALDLVNTPISGDVTFMKGGLTIPDNQGLTGDNIVINKTSRHLPHNNSASLAVDWANSNIQRDTRANATAPNYIFTNALAGQTLTMYVENSHSATLIPSFTSGTTVKWGGPTGGPPHLVVDKTNVYTFVCYDGAIFASAITGYAY